MKKSRFSEEQIVKALQEHEVGGKTIASISRELGISVNTFHK
jgi:transposase-like protein